MSRKTRATGETRSRRRRAPVLTLIASVLLFALLAGGLVIHFRGARGDDDAPRPGREAASGSIEPPAFDTAGVDPAVAKVVLDARSAVSQSPNSDAAWGRLGMLLAAHGFSEHAAACFAQAERLNPREARWVYYQGTDLCRREPAVSVEKLTRALELLGDDPRSASVRLRLGELLLSEGRPDDARRHFEQVLRLDAGSAAAHLNLARVARQQGDLQRALTHLARCADNPHTRKASLLLTVEVRQRLQDVTGAQQARAAAEKLPEDTRWPDEWVEQVERLRTGKKVRLAAALRLIQQNRFSEAAALLEPMTREYPDTEADAIWLLLGRAYFKQRDFPRAEPALRKAAALNPAAPQPRFFLGTMLLYQGKSREAEGELRHAVRLKPDYADAHQNLGHCLLAQEKLDDAAGAFRTAIDCDPNYVDPHLSLAEVLARQGQKAAALEHVRRAIAMSPTNPRARELLERLEQ